MKIPFNLVLNITLSVCVLVPLTNDIFISAIPEMNTIFPIQDISLVLSVSLLGLAISQPFYGPLSDRFGRKPVLLAGLLVYVLSSYQVMMAEQFVILIIGRLFQGIGVCSAISSVLPIVRDTCRENQIAKSTGVIMAIMSSGPAFAPLLGSFLNNSWGWRGGFTALFLLGCLYLIWIFFFFKETHTNLNLHALNINRIFKTYISFVKHSIFLRYCFASGFAYGVLFSYINLSSFFIIERLDFSMLSFGIIVAGNGLIIGITSLITQKVFKTFSIDITIKFGNLFILVAGLLMSGLNIMFNESILTFIIPIVFATLGIGIIRVTSSSAALQLVESRIAGSASSFFNLFSFIFGFSAITITSKRVHDAVSFGFFITAMSILSLLILLILKPANSSKKLLVDS